MSAHPDWVQLLVEAYDHLEDLRPLPGEEPDEQLDSWLDRTATLLLAATGQTAGSLVEARLAKLRGVQ